MILGVSDNKEDANTCQGLETESKNKCFSEKLRRKSFSLNKSIGNTMLETIKRRPSLIVREKVLITSKSKQFFLSWNNNKLDILPVCISEFKFQNVDQKELNERL